MREFIKKYRHILISILIIVFLVSLACCNFLVNYNRVSKSEEGTLVEKGELVPGVSSGLQELSSENEGHVYTYEGVRGETIKIHATTPSDVLLVILVTAPGKEGIWRDFIGDLDGYRGGDAEIIETLPVDGTYKIYVDMADISGKYTIQVDVVE